MASSGGVPCGCACGHSSSTRADTRPPQHSRDTPGETTGHGQHTAVGHCGANGALTLPAWWERFMGAAAVEEGWLLRRRRRVCGGKWQRSVSTCTRVSHSCALLLHALYPRAVRPTRRRSQRDAAGRARVFFYSKRPLSARWPPPIPRAASPAARVRPACNVVQHGGGWTSYRTGCRWGARCCCCAGS